MNFGHARKARNCLLNSLWTDLSEQIVIQVLEIKSRCNLSIVKKQNRWMSKIVVIEFWKIGLLMIIIQLENASFGSLSSAMFPFISY